MSEIGSVLEACKSHGRIITLSLTGCGERSLQTQQVPKGSEVPPVVIKHNIRRHKLHLANSIDTDSP